MIIDTGLELDLMHYNIYQQTGLPINKETPIVMRDAGAHSTLLEGVCQEVTVQIGNVATVCPLLCVGT